MIVGWLSVTEDVEASAASAGGDLDAVTDRAGVELRLVVAETEGVTDSDAVTETDAVAVVTVSSAAEGVGIGDDDLDDVSEVEGVLETVTPPGAHFFAVQMPLRQSRFSRHALPCVHARHRPPPQSAAVSRPSFTPLEHVSGCGDADAALDKCSVHAHSKLVTSSASRPARALSTRASTEQRHSKQYHKQTAA